MLRVTETTKVRLQTRAEDRKRLTNVWMACRYKSSSEDEIANVNFYDDIVHVEARAYAHQT